MTNLKQRRCEYVDWIKVAYLRGQRQVYLNMIVSIWVSYKYKKHLQTHRLPNYLHIEVVSPNVVSDFESDICHLN
jgi:hypothetical protein